MNNDINGESQMQADKGTKEQGTQDYSGYFGSDLFM